MLVVSIVKRHDRREALQYAVAEFELELMRAIRTTNQDLVIFSHEMKRECIFKLDSLIEKGGTGMHTYKTKERRFMALSTEDSAKLRFLRILANATKSFNAANA